MKYLFLIIFMVTSLNVYASTQSLTLKQMIEISEYIGVVEVSSIERIDDCGLLVTAKSVENFKSIKVNKTIKFWINKDSDLFHGIDSYFVILYDVNKSNLCHATSIMGAKGYQSVFPIYEDLENRYILASRSSFLSAMDGKTYASNNDITGNVSKLAVINDRIYAFGNWEAIKSLMLKIVKHEE